MRTIPITLAAIAVLLVLPPAAIGQRSVPPDNAALDEYVEAIPAPTGKTPSGGADRGRGGGGQGGGGQGGGQGGGGQGADLPGGTATALETLGSEGQAVADLAATTAPPQTGSSTRKPGGAGRPGAGAGSADRDGDEADPIAGSSGLRGVIGQTLGGGAEGGMGLVLPLILAAALLGVLAAAQARRRRGAGPSG